MRIKHKAFSLEDGLFSKRNGNIIFGILVIFALFLFLRLYSEILDIQVWRHDELLMLNNYESQMKGEGRWVNYILFPFLKTINPLHAIVISLLC